VSCRREFCLVVMEVLVSEGDMERGSERVKAVPSHIEVLRNPHVISSLFFISTSLFITAFLLFNEVMCREIKHQELAGVVFYPGSQQLGPWSGSLALSPCSGMGRRMKKKNKTKPKLVG